MREYWNPPQKETDLVIWWHQLTSHINTLPSKDQQIWHPCDQVLHDPLKQLMEDVWCDRNIDICKQQSLPERVKDSLDATILTGSVEGVYIAISHGISLKHFSVVTGWKPVAVPKLIMWDNAFGAFTIVCRSHKDLFRVIAYEVGQNGIALAPDVTFSGLQFSFFTCLLILSHHVTFPLHFLSHDHITWPLTYSLTMWFSLAIHVTHTDSYLVACILGLMCESVRLRMTPYLVQWLLTSTGTSSIRLESWQLPRCI